MNQFQLHYGEYQSPPLTQLHHLNYIFSAYLHNNPFSTHLHGKLYAASACFGIHLYVYSGDTRYEYSMITDIPKPLIMHLYANCGGYDSVTKIEIKRLVNNPKPQNQLNLRFATWNVRGAATTQDHALIDYQLNKLKIDIAGIQESHLHSSKLETTHYIWLLGNQYQERASRGIGFLITKSIYPHVKQFIVITPNIAYLTLKAPYMPSNLHFVTVHKMNDSSSESAIETGNNSNFICIDLN